jgi:hypothetical protein
MLGLLSPGAIETTPAHATAALASTAFDATVHTVDTARDVLTSIERAGFSLDDFLDARRAIATPDGVWSRHLWGQTARLYPDAVAETAIGREAHTRLSALLAHPAAVDSASLRAFLDLADMAPIVDPTFAPDLQRFGIAQLRRVLRTAHDDPERNDVAALIAHLRNLPVQESEDAVSTFGAARLTELLEVNPAAANGSHIAELRQLIELVVPELRGSHDVSTWLNAAKVHGLHQEQARFAHERNRRLPPDPTPQVVGERQLLDAIGHVERPLEALPTIRRGLVRLEQRARAAAAQAPDNGLAQDLFRDTVTMTRRNILRIDNVTIPDADGRPGVPGYPDYAEIADAVTAFEFLEQVTAAPARNGVAW